MVYDVLGIVVIIIWSTSGPMIKQMVLNSNGNFLMVVVTYNFIASLISLSISFIRREYRNLPAVSRKAKLLGLAQLNGFYDVAGALAVTFSAAVQYAIIANYMWPILLVVLLAILKQQGMSKRAFIGCILGFSALVVMVIPSDEITF